MEFGLRLSLNGQMKTSPGAPPYTAVPLGDLIASCVFDLDATVAASYDGSSGRWLNLETTPADGAAQAAHDMFLGTTSGADATDPAFNGSAGSSSAYFSGTGTQFFRNVAASAAAQPQFYKDLHKSTGGQLHTIVAAVRFPATGGSLTNRLCGTGGGSTVAHGITYFSPTFTQLDKAGLGWYDGSGANTIINSSVISDGTDKIIAFTFNPGTGAYKIYVNSTTPTTGTASAQVSTTDATYIFELLSGGNGTATATNGWRCYAVSAFAGILADADIGTIRDEWVLRHVRNYF